MTGPTVAEQAERERACAAEGHTGLALGWCVVCGLSREQVDAAPSAALVQRIVTGGAGAGQALSDEQDGHA